MHFSGEFNPGLSRSQIDELTKDLVFSFPEELYELYQWHNGMTGDRGWRNCLISTYEFISLEEAINSTKSLHKLLREYWEPNLFFAFAEGTDNSYVLLFKLGGEFATVFDACPDSGYTSFCYPSITYMILRRAIEITSVGKADLRGINLSNWDFSGWHFYQANLSETNLTNCNFKEANLMRVNLTNAIIENADFTDAIFQETIMPDGSIRSC